MVSSILLLHNAQLLLVYFCFVWAFRLIFCLLKAKEQIKAGDVLIMENPYAAILQPENKLAHCSHCFKMLDGESL